MNVLMQAGTGVLPRNQTDHPILDLELPKLTGHVPLGEGTCFSQSQTVLSTLLPTPASVSTVPAWPPCLQQCIQPTSSGNSSQGIQAAAPGSPPTHACHAGNIDLSPRFAALMPMPGKLTPTLEPEATEVCSMAMSSDRQNREQKSIKSDNMRLPRCRHQWHNQEVPSSGASQTWAPIPALALSALIPSRSNTNASNSIR
nr:uncharacterized protein LOC127491086 isoform X2 [Oryctolagus cuniculus]